MLLSSTMCFSSSIICLLIVTSHSSALPHSDSDPLQGSSTSSSLEDNVQHRHVSDDYNSSNDILEDTSQNSVVSTGTTFSRRKLQSANDDFGLPLPRHKEISSTHTQRRSSHPDHILSSKQTGVTSLKTEKLKHLPINQSHNHHHNDTDDVSESEASNHNHLNLESSSSNNNAYHHTDHSSEHHHHSHDDHESQHHEEKEKVTFLDQKPSSEEKEVNLGHDISCGKKGETHKMSSAEDDHDHEHPGPPSVDFHQHHASPPREVTGKEWLYASLAVVAISLCGLFSVAVIPIMQKWFYHTLLQFLVGLAVGSLSGDGLLHLMPHAILDGQDNHDHSEGNGHHHTNGATLQTMEKTAIWRGLAALGGIFLFFIAERLLGALTTYRRQKKETKLSRHPKNMVPVMQREDGANNGNVGEKLAQPKKNSYDHIREKDEKETIQMLQTEGASPSRKGSNQSVHEVGFHGRSSFSLEPDVSGAFRPESESSVIVSEHHGHGHGHSHDIPQSVTAVAWMVIMGDGLHNFCDGLAIGAAFASGYADGISTTVAVFCHELPHELGDFAMLLKTGMKVKQALFYNGLSSVLCFIGMVIGVSLGNVHSATNWVFAGTAGMFLYIALVDMLPELTSTPTGLASLSTLAVQILGITIGICIMLLIALYEHELHSIVS